MPSPSSRPTTTAGKTRRRRSRDPPRRGGFRIFSRGDYHEIVKDFLTSGQSAKLSQAALETLAVIAYRQPISRPRIAAIRGVSVDGVIRTLLLRGLIVEAGKEATTSALLYTTTHQFLDALGMNSIDGLPEIAPYLPEDADVADKMVVNTLTARAPAKTGLLIRSLICLTALVRPMSSWISRLFTPVP